MNLFDQYLELSQNIAAAYTHIAAARDLYELNPTPENQSKIESAQQTYNSLQEQRAKLLKQIQANA